MKIDTKLQLAQQIIEAEFERFRKLKQLNVDNKIKLWGKNKISIFALLDKLLDKLEILARKIKTTVKDHFQNINLRIAFKSSATLGSHFPFKDKVVDPNKLSGEFFHFPGWFYSQSYCEFTVLKILGFKIWYIRYKKSKILFFILFEIRKYYD